MTIDLAAIGKREKAATKGPWKSVYVPSAGRQIYMPNGTPVCAMRWTDGIRADVDEQVDGDSEFIAESRTDIPGLIAEVKRYRELAKVVREMLPSREWRDQYNRMLKLLKEVHDAQEG